jgi:hypothetical protein
MILPGLFAFFAAAVPFFDGVDDASRAVMDHARKEIEQISRSTATSMSGSLVTSSVSAPISMVSPNCPKAAASRLSK